MMPGNKKHAYHTAPALLAVGILDRNLNLLTGLKLIGLEVRVGILEVAGVDAESKRQGNFLRGRK